jgi:hypothetical protein
VRWHPDRAIAIGVLLVATACGTTLPSPTPTRSAFATGSAPSPSPTAPVAGVPGRPLAAAAVLAAMRESRRPDGVPDQLETELVASRIAEVIWTLDGEPWEAFDVGGSCGAGACVVEVAGRRADGIGEDLWVLDVDPATGAVDVQAAELRALPAGLVAGLDSLARRGASTDLLSTMTLATARWLPPPDEDRFVLSYRSGGEEGACSVEVTVDTSLGGPIDEAATGC